MSLIQPNIVLDSLLGFEFPAALDSTFTPDFAPFVDFCSGPASPLCVAVGNSSSPSGLRSGSPEPLDLRPVRASPASLNADCDEMQAFAPLSKLALWLFVCWSWSLWSLRVRMVACGWETHCLTEQSRRYVADNARPHTRCWLPYWNSACLYSLAREVSKFSDWVCSSERRHCAVRSEQPSSSSVCPMDRPARFRTPFPQSWAASASNDEATCLDSSPQRSFAEGLCPIHLLIRDSSCSCRPCGSTARTACD